MPPVAPSEYPPPFDSESVITAPTDPEDERIEVGVAIVGGGPAGLAAAVKTLQLLVAELEVSRKRLDKAEPLESKKLDYCYQF